MMFSVALARAARARLPQRAYPEAEEILAGTSVPREGADLARGENFVWPPVAALLVSPLTILPPRSPTCDRLLGLACIAAPVARGRPRLAGLRRDGALAAGDRRDPYLAPDAGPLPAAGVAWRYRDTVRPGLAIGLAGAVKFFLWPLGLWLLAIGNARAALLAAAAAAASLLLVLPFTGLDEFLA